MKAAFVLVVLGAGCLRDTEFHCTTDDQCGADGQCEANGYCSVPDFNCVGGRRYSSFSGSETNYCVGPRDGGMQADAAVDAVTPPMCAPGFQPLSGAGSHLYLMVAAADFYTQRAVCAFMGTSTYLAIPDDASELSALIVAGGQTTIWVGIDDLVVEGMFVTVRGQPPPYLPWASGQPDDAGGGEDCVAAQPTGLLEDDRCTQTMPALCECEP